MRNLHALLWATMLVAFPLTSSASHGNDETDHEGNRSHDRREYKEECWDGNCKVERKQKNGKYKEERKCKGPRHGHYRLATVYVPPSSTVTIDPSGVTVHGTVRVGR
jgi:Ni/Co efflux regulator RcnB